MEKKQNTSWGGGVVVDGDTLPVRQEREAKCKSFQLFISVIPHLFQYKIVFEIYKDKQMADLIMSNDDAFEAAGRRGGRH